MRVIVTTMLLAFSAGGAQAFPADCSPPQLRERAASADVKAFVAQSRRRVLTFVGYSGAQYEDPTALLQHAERVLDGEDPARTVINIGATADGIGAVYELAKRKGFTTMGIVSSLARDEKVALSPCVDHVFYIQDTTWGGRRPDGRGLAPTSAAIVRHSTQIVGIGGGEIARDEMLAARRRGKQVRFIAADSNHELARQKAIKRGQPPPTDFRGAAHAAFGKSR